MLEFAAVMPLVYVLLRPLQTLTDLKSVKRAHEWTKDLSQHISLILILQFWARLSSNQLEFVLMGCYCTYNYEKLSTENASILGPANGKLAAITFDTKINIFNCISRVGKIFTSTL